MNPAASRHVRLTLMMLTVCASCRWREEERADRRSGERASKAEVSVTAHDEGGKEQDGDGEAGPVELRPPPETRATLAAGPDLLIITWDTTRADHLGVYGYDRDTTPFLDRFAEEAIVFERYIVGMSTTLPSHTSLFTGVLPEEHGILANALFTGERFVPSDALITLPIFLQGQGYLTAGFVGATPLKKFSGISRGFTAWSEPEGTHRRAEVTVKTALRWLEDAPPDQPLLLWIHFYDPHYPYAPPAEYRDAFKATPEDADRLRELGVRKAGSEDAHTVELVDRYDGEIKYTDRQTARLIAGWKERRSWDRTVVLIVADHGEGLMQHNIQQHGLTWHEQLHAPLLMRIPGEAPRRVPFTVGGNDVLPTLLGRIELPDEARLAAQVSGADTLAPAFQPRPVISRTSVRQVATGADAAWSLTDERWKVIVRPKHPPELYDLSVDPHELHDVSKKYPDEVDAMVDTIKQQVAQQRARAEQLGSGRTEKLDEATLQQLGDLGYLE